VLEAAAIRKDDWIAQVDALILTEAHVLPEGLTDDEWAACYQRISWVLDMRRRSAGRKG
jgi:hypothetical protein